MSYPDIDGLYGYRISDQDRKIIRNIYLFALVMPLAIAGDYVCIEQVQRPVLTY